MNEHIKKLLDKALDQAVPETWTQLSHEQMTRFSSVFAELIVRECSRVYWNIDDGEIHGEYVKALKEHFGIEK